MVKKKKVVKTVKKTKKNVDTPQKTLFEKIEIFLDQRHHLLAIIITGLSLIFSLLMFDAKVSTGLDDSTFLEQGWKYSKDFFGHFFTSQAPFYSMFIALPISIWGLNLVVIKIINLLLVSGSVYMYYRAFRGKIKWLLLFSGLLIYGLNYETLRMASLTYSEGLFLFIQSLFFFWFLRIISQVDNKLDIKEKIKKQWWQIFILGVICYLLYLTRTVGIVSIPAIVIAFLLLKEFKNVIVIGGLTILTFIGMEFVKRTIWTSSDQITTQKNILFQKDAYDATKGNEDFAGFVDRIINNANQYISSRLFEIMGFREHPSQWNMNLTILFIILFLTALIFSLLRREKILIFNNLYFLGILAFTFFALQVSWGQARYVMIVLPHIFIGLFWILVILFSKDSLKSYQFFALFIMFIFVFTNTKFALSKSIENVPIAKANLLEGDLYKGYTPDWENYLKLSAWCKDSLPDNSLVAARKAPMSFIYSNGKKFYPIWSYNPDEGVDSTLIRLKNVGVTHVIVANLRVNPKSSTQGIINTVHRVVQPIEQQYPGTFQLVKTIGSSEEAQLFKINYNAQFNQN
jgi:hypothetical protein